MIRRVRYKCQPRTHLLTASLLLDISVRTFELGSNSCASLLSVLQNVSIKDTIKKKRQCSAETKYRRGEGEREREASEEEERGRAEEETEIMRQRWRKDGGSQRGSEEERSVRRRGGNSTWALNGSLTRGWDSKMKLYAYTHSVTFAHTHTHTHTRWEAFTLDYCMHADKCANSPHTLVYSARWTQFAYV